MLYEFKNSFKIEIRLTVHELHDSRAILNAVSELSSYNNHSLFKLFEDT